ncbi:hypothetical protein O0544_02415 [Edwardsiella anguillarum]|nr:hypothetical protein [Edwardsiella anguillarum]
MWGLGAGANAGVSYWVDGSIDPANAAIAGWVNVFSMGNGLTGTGGWNAAGGALGNWIDDKDPLSGAIMSGSSSAIGYGVGKIIQGPLEKVINPNWKNWEWTDMGMGVSKPLPLNPVPGIAGNIGSSIASEGSGAIIQEQLKTSRRVSDETSISPSAIFNDLAHMVFAIFIMAVVILLFMRLFAFYWIGGDFLFSYADIVRALKISAYCSMLCSVGTWFLYWRNSLR